jgi:carbamoyltransferase
MKQPIYVLGTGLSHDGSACVLKDGRIFVSIEKERLTRNKHDGGNDTLAIQYCLAAANIKASDLTLVVQNANFSMFPAGNDWFLGTRILDDSVPTVTISHHLAHAYSALATSPFKEAAVLVIDGCGNAFDDCLDLAGAVLAEKPEGEIAPLYFEKDSYYIFSARRMTPRYKDFSPFGICHKEFPFVPNTTRHSIGGLYRGASSYVFGDMEDSGKLMGLAPYGRKGVYESPLFELRDGRVFVRYDVVTGLRSPCRSYEQFKERFQDYADIALWVQQEVERALLYVIKHRYELSPNENLCFAGGVALNAVANRRIVIEGPFRRVYFQPAAGDNGLAIGCAFYGWLEVLKQERIMHDGSTSFGIGYSDEAVRTSIESSSAAGLIYQSEDYVRDAARLLADGKVIGWFQAGSEFGPRALGHRSILADPRKVEVRDFINREVKNREDFRPFAPSVIAEDATIYFDCDYESPYMILVAPVRSEWVDVIPAVVHCDRSARIQTVRKSVDPIYYRLLLEFKRLTGLGMLLNTSLNRRKMPIVETPSEAIEFFLSSALDALVLENHVLLKQGDVS